MMPSSRLEERQKKMQGTDDVDIDSKSIEVGIANNPLKEIKKADENSRGDDGKHSSSTGTNKINTSSSTPGQGSKRSLFSLFGKKPKPFDKGGFKITLPHELKEHVIYKDMPYYILEDYMHTLVALPWWKLLLIIIIIIFAAVNLFALLFMAASDGRSWWDSYKLALETWCTIGYGVLNPDTSGEEFVAVITTFCSFTFTAVCTGLAFVKFSLPYAAMTWSNVACVHTYERKPCLVVRAATLMGDERLVDCNFQMFLIAPRVSAEGYVMLSSTELILQNPNPLAMGPNFNLIHEIPPNSSLWDTLNKETEEELNFLIIVRLIAYSMNFQSDVSAMKYYHAKDIKLNHRYVDILGIEQHQTRVKISVDLTRLGTTAPLIPTDTMYLPIHKGLPAYHPSKFPLPSFNRPESLSSSYQTPVLDARKAKYKGQLPNNGSSRRLPDLHVIEKQIEKDEDIQSDPEYDINDCDDDASKDDCDQRASSDKNLTKKQSSKDLAFLADSKVESRGGAGDSSEISQTSGNADGTKINVLARPTSGHGTFKGWNPAVPGNPSKFSSLQEFFDLRRPLSYVSSHVHDLTLSPRTRQARREVGGDDPLRERKVRNRPMIEPVRAKTEVSTNHLMAPRLVKNKSFRECSTTPPKWFDCCRNIHWSDHSSRSGILHTDVKGQSCLFRLQPHFWFAGLTQGRWWVSLTSLFILYWIIILVFAGIMFTNTGTLLEEGEVVEGSFVTHIWWSHHTLSSVGYGDLSPGNALGNFFTTLEGVLGLVLLALMAGVFWAKFSGIQPRILWSNNAVVTTYDDAPHLMIRCASLWKGHLMLTARMRVSVLMAKEAKEDDGEEIISARQVGIQLVREWNPVFALTGTFMHRIEQNSPLVSLLPLPWRKLTKMQVNPAFHGWRVVKVICLLEAFDGLFQQTVVSQKGYVTMDNMEGAHQASTIKIGYKFEDIILQCPDTKKVVINYSGFHRLTKDYISHRNSKLNLFADIKRVKESEKHRRRRRKQGRATEEDVNENHDNNLEERGRRQAQGYKRNVSLDHHTSDTDSETAPLSPQPPPLRSESQPSHKMLHFVSGSFQLHKHRDGERKRPPPVDMGPDDRPELREKVRTTMNQVDENGGGKGDSKGTTSPKQAARKPNANDSTTSDPISICKTSEPSVHDQNSHRNPKHAPNRNPEHGLRRLNIADSKGRNGIVSPANAAAHPNGTDRITGGPGITGALEGQKKKAKRKGLPLNPIAELEYSKEGGEKCPEKGSSRVRNGSSKASLVPSKRSPGYRVGRANRRTEMETDSERKEKQANGRAGADDAEENELHESSPEILIPQRRKLLRYYSESDLHMLQVLSLSDLYHENEEKVKLESKKRKSRRKSLSKGKRKQRSPPLAERHEAISKQKAAATAGVRLDEREEKQVREGEHRKARCFTWGHEERIGLKPQAQKSPKRGHSSKEKGPRMAILEEEGREVLAMNRQAKEEHGREGPKQQTTQAYPQTSPSGWSPTRAGKLRQRMSIGARPTRAARFAKTASGRSTPVQDDLAE